MSIDRYIVDFETVISSHSFVSSYSLTIDRKTRDIAFLSGTREFRNGSVLDFKKFIERKALRLKNIFMDPIIVVAVLSFFAMTIPSIRAHAN